MADPIEEEQIWILQSLQGNEQAFARLMNRYQRKVYNLAYRMLGNAQDAEDATQEAFLRAYSALPSFKLGKRFSPWILSIASNLCIDLLRRRRFLWLSLEDVSYRLPSSTKAPDHEVLQQEKADAVQELLDGLPEKYRLVIILRYWFDLSYKEIAETTGLTLNTVKTRLHRGRNKLAQALEEQENSCAAESLAS